MFRIRRVHDAHLKVNQKLIEGVQALLKARFPGLRQVEVDNLPQKLDNPFVQRFSAVLYVAERSRLHRVEGFALVSREPVLGFGFLDYLAVDEKASGGVGAALYERLREDLLAMSAKGLFFECLPDDDSAGCGAQVVAENRARLRFYERWDARPLVGTSYELPVNREDTCLPHLMCDTLGSPQALRRDHVRAVVRAILERKYAYWCPPEYVETVVASITDDPVQRRARRYAVTRPAAIERLAGPAYPLVLNEKHEIHHVRERGYVESPVRVASIHHALQETHLFRRVHAKDYGEEPILAVHDPEFVDYLRRACRNVPDGRAIYPYVFPIRNVARKPKDLALRAGYYCIDTFTPLSQNAYLAARGAANCAMAAVDQALAGERLVYALVRPPGHHAERKSYGGFCYFNNAAIAAHHLSALGKVAILDVDYHHGNGQQDIFYARPDVLTISLHGHPSFAYPYFTGFAEECGVDAGFGFNVNLPLPEHLDGAKYRKTLSLALQRIREFSPKFLVVALGLDTAKGDPTGSWSLGKDDFYANGELIGALNLPTLVIQEGGYKTSTVGGNAAAFFSGLVQAIRVA